MTKSLKTTIIFGTALIFSLVSVSCGKITEYETQHDCGTYSIATFEDIEALAFAEHTSMKKVAKLFTDFCYYKGEDSVNTAYVAHIPVDMSAFFESEVILKEYFFSDTSGMEEEKTFTFPEYVETLKEEKEDNYKDIGDGSNSELYLYFNADMELSMWQLCPNVEYFGSDIQIFWPTFEKRYSLLDSEFENKTVPVELSGKTYDWPYVVTTVYFSFGDGLLTVCSTGDEDKIKNKSSLNSMKCDITYVP